MKPSKPAPKASKPAKAFVELNGDVHTLPVRIGGADSVEELKSILREAFKASAAPELRKDDLDLDQVRSARMACTRPLHTPFV